MLWVHMASLSVLLFATFTLVYFSLQSAEHAASATARKATAWGVSASPHHVNDNHNQFPAQATEVLRERQGKVNSYKST